MRGGGLAAGRQAAASPPPPAGDAPGQAVPDQPVPPQAAPALDAGYPPVGGPHAGALMPPAREAPPPPVPAHAPVGRAAAGVAGHQGAVIGNPCRCAACGNARFQSTRTHQPRPRRQAYFFGERETVEDLVTRPGMIQRILEDRKEMWDDPSTYWGSPAGRMLNERCGGIFTPPEDPSVVPEEMAVAFTFGTAPLHGCVTRIRRLRCGQSGGCSAWHA